MEKEARTIPVSDDFFIEDTSELEGKYLTFWTNDQLYGIPIAHVVQIVQHQEITSIPESVDYVVGIINLRGSIIPVIDVRRRFGMASNDYTERTCTIVTNISGVKVGFIVDSVNEVTTISDDQVSPPPSISKSNSSAFLTGIGRADNKVFMLLDVRKLLDDQDFQEIAAQYEDGDQVSA